MPGIQLVTSKDVQAMHVHARGRGYDEAQIDAVAVMSGKVLEKHVSQKHVRGVMQQMQREREQKKGAGHRQE